MTSPFLMAKIENVSDLSNFLLNRFFRISFTSRAKNKKPLNSSNQPNTLTTWLFTQNEIINIVKPVIYVKNADRTHFIENPCARLNIGINIYEKPKINSVNQPETPRAICEYIILL